MPFLSENPPVNPGFWIGSFHVAWYGVIIAFAILVATVLCYIFSKKRGIKSEDVIGCALWAIPLSIVGARAGFLIFTPYSYSFVEMLQTWNGGMMIYGGVLGGALGVHAHCCDLSGRIRNAFVWVINKIRGKSRKPIACRPLRKQRFLDYGDLIAPFLLLAQSIGRWGNFINQEAFGLPAGPGQQWFPFSVFIKAGNSQGVPEGWYLATFFYESMWTLIGFAVLFTLLLKTKKRGINVAAYYVYYGIGRAWIESLRMDSLMLLDERISYVISLILIPIGLLMFLYMFWLNQYFDIRQILEKGFNKVFKRKKAAAAGMDTPAENSSETITPETAAGLAEEKPKAIDDNNMENMP